MAAALNGLAKNMEGPGVTGVTGLMPASAGHFKAGVMMGELKQRRYKAMKKSSLRAHVMKRTVYRRLFVSFDLGSRRTEMAAPSP
jgi:hypothetical protein